MSAEAYWRAEAKRLQGEVWRCADLLENGADDLDGGMCSRPDDPRNVARNLRALGQDVRAVRSAFRDPLDVPDEEMAAPSPAA